MIAYSETGLTPFTLVIPGQIPGGQRLDGDLSGERALMMAALEDAVRRIARGHRRHRYRISALAAAAAIRVRADDRAWGTIPATQTAENMNPRVSRTLPAGVIRAERGTFEGFGHLRVAAAVRLRPGAPVDHSHEVIRLGPTATIGVASQLRIGR